jgi:hypothetical protein
MADGNELTITKTEALPELTITSSEVEPVTSKPSSDAEWTALKQQHGLPAKYDLSKNLVENYGNLSKDEINSIDLNKLQQAYTIANPQQAKQPGFFRNMFGEAGDILHGLFEKPTSVAGTENVAPTIAAAKDNPVNLVPLVGPMAVARTRQALSGDISGAMGAGTTDLAALLAPVALSKTIEALPEKPSTTALETLGKYLYDEKTGKVISPQKAATEALIRKLVPDPYEAQRNAARIGKSLTEEEEAFAEHREDQRNLFQSRLEEIQKARQKELSDFGRLKTLDEQRQAREELFKQEQQRQAQQFPRPLRPLVGTPEDWQRYENQMGILEQEASSAGTYHAARGSVKRKLNLQERQGKDILE